MHCSTCPRHTSKHPSITGLLTDQQRDDLQLVLCAGTHESGDCLGDPFTS